ncbi:MAG: hypothetical protein QOG00_3320, partial [Pyrinomonadaceae bacterium]|nr:hypothetical protein [Pyrinomonadaceae bacterium]
WRERGARLAASFALTPFAVFNQQVLTGRSLQPVHYEQFISNYVSLLSLTLACVLVSRNCAAREAGGSTTQETDVRVARETGEGVARENNGRTASETVGRVGIPRKVLAGVALVALGWASVEVVVATRRASQLNLWADEVRPVYLRLSEMARERGVELEPGTERPVVFCPDIALANRLPTVAPQAVLWAPHMFVFSGVTLAEEKERLYQQLYYSNIDAARFSDFISRPHPYRTAVFGSARVLNGLDPNRAPITPADLDAETRAYADYITSFARERAARTPLSYVVTNAAQIDPGNIDRWYTRDAGERVGNYTIYRVKLRP